MAHDPSCDDALDKDSHQLDNSCVNALSDALPQLDSRKSLPLDVIYTYGGGGAAAGSCILYGLWWRSQ